jgi:glycosyltransferase involved in cell wall biosynthesis
MTSKNRTKLIAVFAYLNNHATCTLELLQDSRSDIDLEYLYWQDIPEFRKNNEWKIPDRATRLKLSRPWHFLKNSLRLLRSEKVYFHGFSTPRVAMACLLLSVICFGRCEKIIVASEGLKKKPSRLRKTIMTLFLNSPRIVHLGIGHRAAQDYFEAGLTRWNFRKFCFCEAYPEVEFVETRRSGPLNVLSVGQLIERKNHLRLINAVANLSDPRQVVARIAGDGPLRSELEAVATERGIQDQVSFEGFCTHEQLHDLFQQADVFVLQSHYDGWGVVVGHAAHYGLPIIVSDLVRSGQDFLVEDGVNGFISRSDDDLTRQLEILIGDQELQQKMRLESQKKSKLWNIETTSKRLGMLLDDFRVRFDSGPLSPALVVDE